MDYFQIIWGLIGGTAIGLSGFARKKQKFDVEKIMPVIVTSAIIGGIAGYWNMDFDAVESLAFTGSLGFFVQNIFKGIYRRFSKKK